MKKRLFALSTLCALTLSTLATPSLAALTPDDLVLSLNVNGKTQDLHLSDLAITPFEEEKTGLSRITSWISKDYQFDWNDVNSENAIRKLYKLPTPQHAQFKLNGEELEIVPEKNGVEFNTTALVEDITEDFPRFEKYELTTQEADPITSEELEGLKNQVQTLLSDGFEVSVQKDSYSFPAQLKDITLSKSNGVAHVGFTQAYTNYVMEELNEIADKEATNLTIHSVDNKKAQVEGNLINGHSLDAKLTEKLISGAIRSGETSTTTALKIKKGEIINQSETDLGALELLSTGLSDFSTSPEGRDFNVRKALNDHYNGVVIPEGATFKFNELLGPVTYSAGWAGSYAIFNGNELRTVPGGGVCQVSTTIYRAALNAGLDIQQQRNHSLYVHYYEAHGDGQDSTIFPGVQDLVFENNTGAPILIEAYAEGTDAIVNFYGTSDGRSVELNGPFTKSNQTEEVIEATGGLSIRDIAWQQKVTWPNGETREDWRISKYKQAVTQY